MGIRFRKVISLGKYARVNVSKSGLSLNVGRPGASVSTGQRGTYLNLGLPGTGLSSRTRIGGSSKKKAAGSSSSSGRTSTKKAAEVSLTPSGTEHEQLQAATEPAAELPSYQPSDPVASQQSEAAGIQEASADAGDETDGWLNLHDYAPEVLSAEGLSGNIDDAIIEELVTEWLDQLVLPFEMDAQLEYHSASATLFIDLDLPEIEDLPATRAELLRSGEVKQREKTQKQLRHEYAQLVFGLCVFMAASIFNLNGFIQNVVISGCTQRRDTKGDLHDDYICSVKIARDSLVGMRVSDPEAFFLSCPNRLRMSVGNVFSTIEPFSLPET